MGYSFTGLFIALDTKIRNDGSTRYYVLLANGADAVRFGVPQIVYDALAANAKLGVVVHLSDVSINAFNGNIYPSASSFEFEGV